MRVIPCLDFIAFYLPLFGLNWGGKSGDHPQFQLIEPSLLVLGVKVIVLLSTIGLTFCTVAVIVPLAPAIEIEETLVIAPNDTPKLLPISFIVGQLGHEF